MRVQVAYDRAVRRARKVLTPTGSTRPRSPFDGSPRSLRFPNRKAPSPKRIAAQVILLTLSLLVFLHALISFIHEFRYRPLKHWKTYNAAPHSSVSLVLACNTSHLLNRTVSSSRLNELHGVSIAISTSLISADSYSATADDFEYTLLGGDWSSLAAINLAASRASAHWLLLLPCGCSVPSQLIPPAHSESSRVAYFVERGNPYDICSYTALVRKKDFFRVRGLDERGQGVFDTSLMHRLSSAGIEINRHLAVDTVDFDADSAVSIAADVILQKSSPPWYTLDGTTGIKATSLHDVPYLDEIERAQVKRGEQIARIGKYSAEYTFRRGIYYPRRRAISHAAFIEGLSQAPKILAEARELAHRHVLRARYGFPLALSNGMASNDLYRLLTDLAFGERTRSASLLDKNSIGKNHALASASRNMNGARELRPKIMVIQPMHGLGNRLRALASARTYARNTRRLLVVIWERDAHCLASWDDLFTSMRDIFVTNVAPQWPPNYMEMRADPAWIQWSVVDYMDVHQKDTAISAEQGRHVILRSAFVLKADPPSLSTWADMNVELRALIPSDSVALEVARVEKNILRIPGNINVRTAVGVHVRSRKVEGEIHGAVYTRNATDLISYWRGKSAPEVFLKNMERTDIYPKDTAFIVAADTDEGRENFIGKHNVAVLEGCEGRTAKCVQVAFAEMLILARTRELLASPWSSFSEVIERLGGLNMKMAGIDFEADVVDEKFRKLYGESVALVVEEVQKRRLEKIMRRNKRRRL